MRGKLRPLRGDGRQPRCIEPTPYEIEQERMLTPQSGLDSPISGQFGYD
jgi:hypothetical protein